MLTTTTHKQVAEVRSRFEGQEGGIEAFVAACKGLGLACRRVDKGNKMFFLADFVKEGTGAGQGAGGAAGVVGGGKKPQPQQKRQQQHKPVKRQQGKGEGGGGGGKGQEAAGGGSAPFQAKPCIYKRR